MMRPGIRVVRGPDWQSKKQDGGEGHAGTIIYFPKEGSSDDKVTVIWDNGRELRYRAGKDGKYDLRVLDNAQNGIQHSTVTCDACNENPIIGLRWKCSTCINFDLCTKCYMMEQHDVSHGFMRIDAEHTVAIAIPPRNMSKSMTVQGVFKGALVIRGPHWKWRNDDGSEEGDVIDIVNWQNISPRGGVKVKWQQTKKEGTYRMGGEGCVDIIYTEAKALGKYFIEHLPLLDIVNAGEVILRNSDKVIVNQTLENFKTLQVLDMYGCWNDAMVQCVKEEGTVVKTLYEGQACRVQYQDGKIWTLNRQTLYRVHSFSAGDAVTILSDDNIVRELQEGHGGWNDEMKYTLGAVGRIVHIDSDGDMRVKVGDKIWVYSPVCCEPVHDPNLAGKVPELDKSEMEDVDVDDLHRMQRDFESVAEVLADLFVGLLRGATNESGDEPVVVAAAQGDLNKVKDIIQKNPAKCIDVCLVLQVNATHKNKTALQLASYEGKIDVVKFLLDKKADVNKSDEEGDTALHFSAFGQEEGSMKLLLDHGSKPDAQNKKGQTSLHISVGKGCVPCTKLLLIHGASVNIKDKDGDTPMHDTVIQKKKQMMLIDAVFNASKADFSIQNKKGFNLLQLASLKDCRKAFEIVLAKSPSLINSQMKEGFAALHICAANDHVEIASGLLKAKANKDIQDINGQTALHIAVNQSHKRTVELLLTYECKVDIQDNEGNTPLHVAQINRALPDRLARLLGIPITNDDTGIQISCLLIEAGASIQTKNKVGKTPVDLCTNEPTKEFLTRLSKKATGKLLQKSQKGVLIPTHWVEMARGDSMKRVHLDTTNGLLQKEFQEVQNRFCKTLPQARIHKIERVQNILLWEHFYFTRMHFEGAYGKGCINELDLYHGTDPQNVDIICQSNLDHRLAGDKVGALYGRGSYFALDAKYSDEYSSMDTNHHKFMLQCRVLAGKWTRGYPNYKRPPNTDSKDPKSRLYDSCVDDIDNPKIFCLFDHNQYYPEYVIEYE